MNKLGGNPELVCSRKDDMETVNQIIMLSSSFNEVDDDEKIDTDESDESSVDKWIRACGGKRNKIVKWKNKVKEGKKQRAKNFPSVKIQVCGVDQLMSAFHKFTFGSIFSC